MTTITVHSFKAGTGKSLLSVVLAYEYSKASEKVLLIDGDFNTPSLGSYYPHEAKIRSFTTFLEGKHNLKDCIADTGQDNLSMCYAPNPVIGGDLLDTDSRTQVRYLKRMQEAISQAENDFGFDKIIIDSSSDVSYAAVNQISVSDRLLLVVRPVGYEVVDAYEKMSSVYRKIRDMDTNPNREDYHVWNQVPTNDNASFDAEISSFLERWNEKFKGIGISVGATIPYLYRIVSEMITNDSLNPAPLSDILRPHISELIKKLG